MEADVHTSGSQPDSGDLGRRITEQRRRAGLSLAEAAARAGMAPSYLRYLETSPVPNPAPGDISFLAQALDTTSEALRGAGLGHPPGQSGPGEAPVPEQLSTQECQEHLAGGGIGRFVFLTARGPVAEPVNFRMLGPDVVFRTSEDSEMAGAADQPRVSFEVDRLDEDLAEGWSVLVSGQASVVTAAEELAAIGRLGLAPWAGGRRDCYIRIAPREISGRRLRTAPNTRAGRAEGPSRAGQDASARGPAAAGDLAGMVNDT
jgi:nitroimidazol reductase NimA-like FMN-containing flavoprotein (pyridoxamine 5'-phosphate oxidase superfamily)